MQQVSAHIRADRLDAAAALLRPALQQYPDTVPFLNAMGIVMLRKNQPQWAGQHFAHALQLIADQPATLYNLSVCQQQMGELDAALDSLHQAVRLQPNLAIAHNAIGFLLVRQHKFAEAAQSYRAAVQAEPGNADYHSNLGGMLLALEQPEAALSSFDQALKLAPQMVEALANRAQALDRLDRHAEAVTAWNLAIARAPDQPDYHMQKGNALRQLKRYDDSLAALNRALQLAPDRGDVWRNHGLTLKARKDFAGAIRDFQQATTLEPQQAENHNLLANTLVQEQRVAEALPHYDQALKLKPDFAWALNNRANAYKELGQLDKAAADFDAAIALSADTAVFRWNKSLLSLLTGDFATGWEMFEARWEKRIITTAEENLSYPRWNGEKDIRGKTILLHAEQGLGDSIQFCRYVPMVAALGAKIVLSVQPGLRSVMETLYPDMTIITRGDAHGEIDLQCPLMSLPKAFATELSSIPADIPYLYPDTVKVSDWQAKLGKKARPRIGLVWSGHAGLLPDKARSLAAEKLAPLQALPFDFHGLQKDIRPADSAALDEMGFITRHDAELEDFSDTAALISAMDLVVSVDTSVAHMAGALGKPLWLLIPFAPDWRWLLNREDSPWYPTARLFRQSEKGNWAEVIDRVQAALASRFNL